METQLSGLRQQGRLKLESAVVQVAIEEDRATQYSTLKLSIVQFRVENSEYSAG